MRRSRLLIAKSVDAVAYRCLLQALRRCGVAYGHVLPSEPPTQLRSGPASSFSPLFTTKFDFHHHQLTTLGDALIDRYLSAAVLEYCTRHGTVLTTNAAGELNAVLHNHFILRLFAKEMQFDAMAMSPGAGVEDAQLSKENALSFLEAEKTSVRRQDVAGTSHQVSLLPCGQSALGWKFSHFIGAVHQTLGQESAAHVLEHVYQLDGKPNLPRRASQLLLRVLEHFPAVNVAEAVLAAQGMAVHYSAKSRLLPDEVPESDRSSADRPSQGPTAASSGEKKEEEGTRSGTGNSVDELSIVSGFDPTRSAQSDITLDALTHGKGRSASLARGPGLVDSVEVWRRRTEELVRRNLEPPAVLSDSALSPSSAHGSNDGWLSAEEQAAYQRGPAFAGWVDFTAFATYADVYGPAQPENGRIVRRSKFKKPVRDPRFYDKLSDARNGVPFYTNGEPLPSYLDAFAHPHRRLFEVAMQAGSNGEMKLVGRAISPRYTSARESAARAFLGGVLRDVLSFDHFDAASEANARVV